MYAATMTRDRSGSKGGERGIAIAVAGSVAAIAAAELLGPGDPAVLSAVIGIGLAAAMERLRRLWIASLRRSRA